MSSSCSDVCEVVHDMLIGLGFKIDPDDENHDDLLEALGKVSLVRCSPNDKALVHVVVGVDGGCIDTVRAWATEKAAKKDLAEVDKGLGIERDEEGRYDHPTASAGIFEAELQ